MAADHPRIRGEHPRGRFRDRRHPGIIPAYAGSTSSRKMTQASRADHPRIRGEHPRGRFRDRRHPGIIPAYAGSTSSRKMTQASRADHPRIRGEHIRGVEALLPLDGSSPHTRGAQLFNAHQTARDRDHPRIRGEHGGSIMPVENVPGSSPHTRGALSTTNSCEGRARIIPAYAGSTLEPRGDTGGERDHPRIRGEHPAASRCTVPNGRIIPAYAGSTSPTDTLSRRPHGSSPHTRGAPDRIIAMAEKSRIIPAYAGSTFISIYCCASSGDHPRIRGEHHAFVYLLDFLDGSSPHTRGARPSPVHQHVPDGIIPAYAGSTIVDRSGSQAAADHPRIRGEHTDSLQPGDIVFGSSPHTRGAHIDGRSEGYQPGIIPAYAGSTTPDLGRPQGPPDHPRIRGEHRVFHRFLGWSLGSSPHTRGAQPGQQIRLDLTRIIPAYAGSTCMPEGSRKLTRDHPRIRGEHGGLMSEEITSDGSSPHTRGAPGSIPISCAMSWIIPAYAGSTLLFKGLERWLWDHPRIRGEHGTPSMPLTAATGSSPHTRGAHDHSHDEGFGVGIIPAYAGSTGAVESGTPSMPDHPRIRGEHLIPATPTRSPMGSSPHTRGALRCRCRCPRG